MILALLVWLVAQSDPLEKDLSDILRRFESPEATLREAASSDLEAFCRKAGAKAVDYLRRHADSPEPEVKARIRSQLSWLTKVEECRKLLSIFDAAGLPDCSGKKFAIYNPNWLGQHNDDAVFQYFLGWVLSESKDEVILAKANLTIESYTRDRRLPKEWKEIRKREPADLPPPGEILEIGLREFCKGLVFHADHTVYMINPKWDKSAAYFTADGTALALYAYRLLQLGEDKPALDLVEQSKAAYGRWGNRFQGMAYPEILRIEIAQLLRGEPIRGANRGRSRKELLQDWKRIEEVAPLLNQGEPKEMRQLYEELLTEDASWKDPSPQELQTMAPAGQAAVWMHRLKDHFAAEHGPTGFCYVLGWAGGKDYVNPAYELVKLGWDALPLVIERLDDPHPTRCTHSLKMGPEYLMRVGDCCQQIFEAMSGITIYEHRQGSILMVQDGDAPASKAKALKWWEEHQKDGPEQYYLGRLKTKEGAYFSTKRLLEMDAKKHLPVLMEVFEKGDRDLRKSLLPLLRRHWTKSHQPLMESFLKDEDLYVVIEAANALWEVCRLESGALEAIRRLKELKQGDEDEALRVSFTARAAFDLCRMIGSEQIVVEVAVLARSPIVEIRINAMQSLGQIPSRKSAEILVDQLGDRTLTGWNLPRRYCDGAAQALIEMFGLRSQFGSDTGPEARDLTIQKLGAWWVEQRDSLDWVALRRKSDAERASKR